VTKHDLIYRQQKIYNQRYQWPLAASLLMLLTSLTVGTRRSSGRRASAVPRAVAVSAASVVMAVLVIPMRSEGADQVNSQANGQANDPGTAGGAAGVAAGGAAGGAAGSAAGGARAPVLEYNSGTSAYRAGQFSQATQSFQQSIKDGTGERRQAPGRSTGRLLQPR
jgi:TolA-binding protein